MNAYFDEHTVQAGHGRQSVRGGAMMMGARAINGLIQVGSVLCLARLLSPEDYGLVAMVTAITGFAPVLVDFGTRDAIVQRARVTRGEVSALFWIATAVGCAFSLLVIATGPLIASFYGEPRLTAIVAWSSLAFVASALISQHQALLRRALMYRELAGVEVASNLISAIIAIAMAYSGSGYWALVLKPLIMYGCMAAGVWVYCRWLPGSPTLTAGVKDMVRFGLNLTGFSLTDFAGRNGDRVAVGRTLGATTLGYYQNALFVYDNLLDVLVISLHQVAVASLSKLQNDRAELKKAWEKALSTLAFYSMPAFGVLAVTSRDVIVLLLGAKWGTAGILLSILALRGIPHSVERTLGWLHVASGRTDRWFRWGVVSTCVQLAAMLFGLQFGTTGVVIAAVAAMYVLFLPTIAYAGHPLGIGVRDVIRATWRQLTGALVAVGFCFALRRFYLADVPAIQRTILLATAYLATYLIIVVAILKVTKPAAVFLALIGDALPVGWKLKSHLRLAQVRK